jgi:Sigma-70, region 4
VAAPQSLTPKQRAALILRDVLRWKAKEVATLLDSTTVSVEEPSAPHPRRELRSRSRRVSVMPQRNDT